MTTIDDACDVMGQAAKRITELESALRRCVFDLRSATMIMPAEARATAISLIRKYEAVLNGGKR